MAWDHYFIEGGAEHSAEIMRLLPFVMFSGQEGIVNPTDCKVTELATPGGSVNVAPGAVAFQNRTPGYDQQMYVGRLASQEPVTVAPTDSSGTRSDLIVIRSENPISGTAWAAPADPAAGPYFFTRVIPDVDPTTTSYQDTGGGDSAYALARIDLPASTATVTNDMIVDLRNLAQPRKEFHQESLTHSGSLLITTSAAYTNFPQENGAFSVPVPPWATHMDCKIELILPACNSAANPANLFGNNRSLVNGVAQGFSEWNVDWNGGQVRFTMALAYDMDVTAHQGTTITVQHQAQIQGGAGELREDNGTNTIIQAFFTEKPL